MLKSYFNALSFQSQLFLIPLLLISGFITYAQDNSVAIGSEIVNTKAVLMLVSPGNNQGLMIPVVTDRANINAGSTEEGMIVYDSSDKKIYYWNATGWIEVGGSGSEGTTYGLTYDASTGNIILVEGGAGLSISPSLSGDITGNLHETQINEKAVGLTELKDMNASADQYLVFNGVAWEVRDIPSGTFSGVSTDATLSGNGDATDLGVVSSQLDGSVIPNLPDASATNEIQTVLFDTGTNELSITDPNNVNNQTVDLNSLSGGSGIDGLTSLSNSSIEPAGANCTDGGARVDVGLDDNASGVLDAAEIDYTYYVCNGSNGIGSAGTNGIDGLNSLSTSSVEPAGANCTDGGTRIDVGLDDNDNGTLEGGEVDYTYYTCAGAAGANGTDGVDGIDGLNSLSTSSVEPAGANCTDGGTRIDVGLDDNDNGTLEGGEVDYTYYACAGGAGTNGVDGVDGIDGLNSLSTSSVEPAGANCTDGGTRIDVGLDDNANGTLEGGEVDYTYYACAGSQGSIGASGLNSLSGTTLEPAGANCTDGGIRVDVGLDDDASGTLSGAEIDYTYYVCDGAQGVAGLDGDRYATTSSTNHTISTGSKTFTVDLNLGYSAGQTALLAINGSNFMEGTVTSYNSGTGDLVVNITSITGSGSSSAWTVNLNGAPGPSGSDGLNTISSSSIEPAGVNCANGGIRVDVGLDDDANGTLIAGEIDYTYYVCDGAAATNGVDGADGIDGLNSLSSSSIEPAGVNCTDGGTRVDVGIDDNINGTLEGGEIDYTYYVCSAAAGTNGVDGLDGIDGLNSLSSSSVEPAGANCADGGTRVDVGIDDNINGTLEGGEIDYTYYVCSGAAGTNGVDGLDGIDGLNSLSSSSVEPAGANCTDGGTRVDVGIDDNINGTLEGGEIDYTYYVCDGASAPSNLSGLTDANVVTPLSSQILVYDGITEFDNVSMSGDATIANTGALTITNNAIGTAEITNGSVGTIDITNDAITTGKIADGSITIDDIQSPGNDMVLTSAAGGAVTWAAKSSLPYLSTASNGLTATGGNVALGGTMTQTTTFAGASDDMYFNDFNEFTVAANITAFSTQAGVSVAEISNETFFIGNGTNTARFQYRDGNEDGGKVLTSGGTGIATWQTPAISPWSVSGSDIERLSGNIGIGVAPNSTEKVRISTNSSTARTGLNVATVYSGTGVSYGIRASNTSPGATGTVYGVQGSAYSNGTVGITGIYSEVEHEGSGPAYLFRGEHAIASSGIDYGIYMSTDEMNYFSGSVGIGTNVPENTLHIQDLVNSPILKIEGPVNGAGIDPILRFTEVFPTDYGFDFYLDTDQNALKIRSIEIGATAVDNILNIERSSGDIGIGTDNPSAKLDVVGDVETSGDYTYSSAKTRYLSVSAAKFRSINTTEDFVINGPFTDSSTDIYGYFTGSASAQYAHAVSDIQLPNGATITSLTGYIYDNETNNSTWDQAEVFLRRQVLRTGSSSQIGSVQATINSTSTQEISSAISSVIDNRNYVYTLTYISDRFSGTNQRLYGVVITYTVTEAD